jgi:hypothetical protein
VVLFVVLLLLLLSAAVSVVLLHFLLPVVLRSGAMFGAERSGVLVLIALWEPLPVRRAALSGAMFGAERSGAMFGAKWSDVWSGAKFLSCAVFSGLSLLPVAVHVACVSLSLFLSLLAIGESGGKGWISCCRVTTESYIIEL